MRRTSQSHPLKIDIVAAGPAPGRIGMTFCPGKVQAHALTGAWERDLDTDLGVIAGAGATALVSAMEPHELTELRVPKLSERARELGMTWWGIPIPDGGIPVGQIDDRYRAEVEPDLLRRLRGGELIVVHCKGGLGRTGLISARLLVALGVPARIAISQVRAARPGTIETAIQERFVLALES